jgi:hypothetical protein
MRHCDLRPPRLEASNDGVSVTVVRPRMVPVIAGCPAIVGMTSCLSDRSSKLGRPAHLSSFDGFMTGRS